MPLAHMLLAVLISALWGWNYIAAKIGMEVFPPIFYTMLRFILVAGMLLPFFPRPSRNQLHRIFWIALVLCVGHMSLILYSLHLGLTIASSVIIVQLGVPFSCILGVLLLGDRIGRWRTLGLIISFCGILVIAGTPNIAENRWAFAIAMFSTFCWAVSNIQMKKLGNIPTLQLMGWMSLFAAPMLLVTSLLLEGPQWHAPMQASWREWLALAYTTLGSTLIAYGSWAYLIKLYDVSVVAPYSLLIPIFAIAAGWVWFHEPLTSTTLIGAALTIFGVAIITIRRPKMLWFGKT